MSGSSAATSVEDEKVVVCNHNVVLCALRGGRIKGVRRISMQNHIFYKTAKYRRTKQRSGYTSQGLVQRRSRLVRSLEQAL